MTGIVQTTEPAGEPVTLAEARSWLRVDGTEEDTLIAVLIEAARTYVENFTRRALVKRAFEYSLERFPNCGEIILPRSPLIATGSPAKAVQSIQYYDTDETLQTFAAANYHIDSRAQPGRIVLHQDYDWPDTDVRPNAVIIAFTAGYGTSSDVPASLRTAIRYLVSHWFENRVHVNIGNIVNEIPDTVERLLWQYRIPVFA